MGTTRAQRVGEILVKARLIDRLQLRSALARHQKWGGRLAHVVVELGFAPEEQVVDALAEALNVPRVRLGHIQRDPAALSKVDVTFADEKAIFPVQFKEQGRVLVLAMADPADLETVDTLGRNARARVQTQIAGELEIRSAIDRHYRGIEHDNAGAATRARKPAPLGGEDEEEFKLVDREGNTLRRPFAEVAPNLARELAERQANGSAAELLKEMAAVVDPLELTEEEHERLSVVRQNQEKSTKVIRAVLQLLMDKGYVTREQLASRMQRQA